ncbi:hypothetical protein HYH03_017793 [Edaphochlamys debaryana]|uniref:FPL domain-containing protein n=1 Tax=Edaphochlamys debaryana TaxID=47281 RepID=A0A835XHA8_9CHLO|nr:hypothetical protein HYH03_017793 [Edaphochlamys debaryana]|eukprot:KAG2483345.1 hypothetical protein HYH03_017793 [Edaphochlamys debaryana]
MFEQLKKNWQSLFTSAATSGRTKYTFEELRALSDVLTKNQVVTDANKAVVVETIRSIAEFMIWGDQNEPRIFDFFLENNIMHYLHKVLQQPANRSGDVAKQVLQTLSIIIQNIRSETGTYFLFSNNHINNIVEIRFDFDDEEVLGYYISFLKTISLKLNLRTVQFFFDRREPLYTFPLYSEAVKFAHHKEGMVRAGVRTLTLNVYSVSDPDVRNYVCRPPVTNYLVEVAAYIAEQVKILDKRMATAEGFSAQVLSSLDSQIAEVEDMVSYVADVLSTAPPKLAHLVAEQLWVTLVGPSLLRPLLEYSGTSSSRPTAVTGTRTSGGGAPGSPPLATPVRAVCALYVLERLFATISYPPLLHNLALAFLDPRPGHPSCRPALDAILRSSDHRAVPAALRCLVALIHNRSAAPELLALLGVPPRSRAADLAAACPAAACGACRLQEQLTPLPEGASGPGVGPDPLANEPLPVVTVVGPAMGGGSGPAPAPGTVFGYHIVWTELEGPAQGGPRHDLDGREGPVRPRGGSSEEGEAAAAEETDLLGLGTDGEGEGDRSVEGASSQGGEPPSPAVIRITPSTALRYSGGGAAPDGAEAASGPGAGAASASEGDLLGLGDDGVAAPSALAPNPDGAPAASQSQGDLLGLGDLLLPAAVPADTGTHTPALAAEGDGSPRAASESIYAGASGGGDAAAAAVASASEPAGAAAGAGPLVDLLGSFETSPPKADGSPTGGAEEGPKVSGEAQAGPPSDPGDAPLTAEVAASEPAPEARPAATTEVPAGTAAAAGPGPGSAAAAPAPAPAPAAPSDLLSSSSSGLQGLLDALPAAAAAAAAAAATAIASTTSVLADPLGAVAAAANEPPPEPRSGDGDSSSALGSAGGSSPSAATTPVHYPSASASAAASLIESSGPSGRPGQPAAEPEAPAPPAGPPCADHARVAAAAAAGSDLLDALFGLLSMPLLPIPGLWNVGLLLSQLYPRAEEQRQLAEELREAAAAAAAAAAASDPLADLLASSDGGAVPSAAAATTPSEPLRPQPAAPSEAESPLHPLDPASTAGWACCLTGSQREALRVAAVSAASAVMDEVGGMWADALAAMLVMEWPAAYDGVTRPSLRTGAETLLAGPHLFPRASNRGLSGAARNDQGLSGSAVAALHSHHAVCRLVALLHLHELLQRGATSRRPPPACPLPGGGAEAGGVEAREGDILEGQEVELQAGSAIPCIVSFSPGQERRVYFAAAGPALKRLGAALQDPQSLLLDASARSAVLHSSPAVVLADPAPTRLNAGIALSVSPMLGCDPSVDKAVAKWLHVHVRPSVRGLLRLLRSAAAGRKGGLLAALRHLVDGHWVLAFPDAERAANARQLVEQSSAKLRALYCELLSPLLGAVME